MGKSKFINVKNLAKLLKVNPKTLKCWLCNYNLNKYKEEVCLKANQKEYYYRITKESMRCLKKYISQKGITYEERFLKAEKRIENNTV